MYAMIYMWMEVRGQFHGGAPPHTLWVGSEDGSQRCRARMTGSLYLPDHHPGLIRFILNVNLV